MLSLFRSQMVRNTGKLLSANVIAQAIGLLVYPLLTRIYAPEDFGLFNLFVSIGGVAVLIATGNYQNAIVLPKREETARGLVHLSALITAATVLLLILSIPFAHPIAGLFKSPDLATYYWLLPFYVLLASIWNVLNYWYLRHQAYDRISGYQVSQSLFSAAYKTGFGYAGWLRGGLISAAVLSPLCSLILSVFSARKYLKPLLQFDGNECRQAAAQYSNFPKFALPHSVLNYVASQLPVLLLTPLFSAREVGFWSMAILLSFAPISLITNAIHQVFFQRTTEHVNARLSIAPFYRRFTLASLAIIIPFFAGLWFVLPDLTQWLLGDEWSVSGRYIRWMLPWLLCMFLCASTGYLYDVFARQRSGLFFEIAMSVARLIGLGVGICYDSFELAIAGYAVAGAIVNGAQYIWLMHLVRRYERSL